MCGHRTWACFHPNREVSAVAGGRTRGRCSLQRCESRHSSAPVRLVLKKKNKSWEVNSQASGHNPSTSRFFSLREFSCCQHTLGKKSDFLQQWKKARKAVPKAEKWGRVRKIFGCHRSDGKDSRFQEVCEQEGLAVGFSDL